jgi:hypothetical protein
MNGTLLWLAVLPFCRVDVSVDEHGYRAQPGRIHRKILGIYRAPIPFVVLQLLELSLVAIFPQLATWLAAKFSDHSCSTDFRWPAQTIDHT